jgi:hypothetical protein
MANTLRSIRLSDNHFMSGRVTFGAQRKRMNVRITTLLPTIRVQKQHTEFDQHGLPNEAWTAETGPLIQNVAHVIQDYPATPKLQATYNSRLEGRVGYCED